jgi:hypothetical protein
MAINIINSQGLLLKVATAVTGTPVVADFSAAKIVGCPQSLGTIEQSRAVTEYQCMSSDDSIKSLGSITRGNLSLSLLFDPSDTAGQADLKAAFAANTTFLFGVELPNADTSVGSTGASGTTFAFIGAISAVSIGIEKDAAVMYDLTIEIASAVTELAMVAGTV